MRRISIVSRFALTMPLVIGFGLAAVPAYADQDRPAHHPSGAQAMVIYAAGLVDEAGQAGTEVEERSALLDEALYLLTRVIEERTSSPIALRLVEGDRVAGLTYREVELAAELAQARLDQEAAATAAEPPEALDGIMAERDALQEDLAEREEELAELNVKLQARDTEIDRMMAELESVNLDREVLDSQVGSLTAQVGALEGLVRDLSERLEAAAAAAALSAPPPPTNGDPADPEDLIEEGNDEAGFSIPALEGTPLEGLLDDLELPDFR